MNRPSSIVVFATQHMPIGGIESHLREFCLHVAKSGVQIDLVVTNSAMHPDTEEFYRRVCRRVYLGRQGRSSLRLAWLLLVGLRLSVRQYDALYSNGQGESVGMLARLLWRRHTWVHHHHTAGDLADQAAWGKGYVNVLKQANIVIACSGRNAADIAKAVGRAIDVIYIFSAKVKLQPHTAPKSDRLRFGYYGRLIPEKGIDHICRLSEDADLRDVEFHLWGEGAAYPASFFEKFPHIHYHGSFNGAKELVKVIQTIDAMLLLSTHPEGLPVSLLEAMSGGIPWVATDRGGVSDIACDLKSTRVIPVSSDYNQIKAAVLSLVTDLRAGLVSKTAQMELYEQKFSPPTLVAQWLRVLGLKELVKVDLN